MNLCWPDVMIYENDQSGKTESTQFFNNKKTTLEMTCPNGSVKNVGGRFVLLDMLDWCQSYPVKPDKKHEQMS